MSVSITSDITTVNNESNEMKKYSTQTNSSAERLTNVATELKKMIEKFKLAA